MKALQAIALIIVIIAALLFGANLLGVNTNVFQQSANNQPTSEATQIAPPTNTAEVSTFGGEEEFSCPLQRGQTSHDPALVNPAIVRFANQQLRQIEGLPWPVTNAAELLLYFGITERSPEEVEVDWDCISIQLPGVYVDGAYKAFHATNPLCAIAFDGFTHAWQDDGTVVTGVAQIGFKPGTWLMEGITWFYKGPDSCAQPPIITNCTPDSVAAQLGYTGVTDVSSFLLYFQVQEIVGTIKIVVEPDCRTLEIHVGNPDTDYFSITNPFAHLDGYLWHEQPGHPEWSLSDGRTGIPTGTWLSQGVTVWPGLR